MYRRGSDEECKLEHANAVAALEHAKQFKLAGATTTLLQPVIRAARRRMAPVTMSAPEDAAPPAEAMLAEPTDPSLGSLEQKMASWEASEAEQRSATLGGGLPLVGMPGLPGRMTRTDQPKKLDGFDLGMNLSGLILFPLAIAVFAFPFFLDSIDVNSVGPPPTS